MGFKSPQQAAMSVQQLSLYGVSNAAMDNMGDVEDLAIAMGELIGIHVTATCKAKADGNGVWTNITGSRNPRGSDIPDANGRRAGFEQRSMSLGDERKGGPASAISGDVDDGDLPY